jgi:thiaminase
MEQNYYHIFYKIIEDPTCTRYYRDLIQYYKSKNKEIFVKAIEGLLEKLSNDQ